MHTLNRQTHFDEKHSYNCNFPEPDTAKIREKYVDDDGNLQTIERIVVDDSKKVLLDNPAYTDKIEYMQQYGTLQDGEVITYGIARTSEMNPYDIAKMTNKIINNNLEEKKIEDNKQEQKEENV